MPKIKITVINGKPATPGVALDSRRFDLNDEELKPGEQGPRNEKGELYAIKIVKRVLVPEGVQADPNGDPNIECVSTADVDDLEPFKALLDRGLIQTVAGRPRKASDAAAANPDPD